MQAWILSKKVLKDSGLKLGKLTGTESILTMKVKDKSSVSRAMGTKFLNTHSRGLK